MRFIMKGATEKNTCYADKPDEDYFFFDEASGFAMILDGVTRDRENGIYPNPSPACLCRGGAGRTFEQKRRFANRSP